MVLQSNDQTTWVAEHLIKDKTDIDLIAEFATTPKCDVEAVNRAAAAYGERVLVRGHIPCFDVFGQPGCRQDACCLAGTQRMIMETFDDPEWVRAFLGILQKRKLGFVRSLKRARYDILELGGGDADLTEAKRRIGDRVCLIGGFDQFHYLQGCGADETRRAVRACFEQAGEGGGYILATSDHFFDAEPELIEAYADEARRCRY